MKKIFKDAGKQARFNEQGYVVQPFISKEQVAGIRALYNELHPEGNAGFYSSSFSKDDAYLEKINAAVLELIAPQLLEHFEDFKLLGASFLVKNPGDPGQMPIHQDWTVVNEEESFSMTIWVPLENVSRGNGAIKVLPRSQKMNPSLRGPSLPDMLKPAGAVIEANMVTLNMKEGDGFIFNQALIHSSHLNQTDHPRVAVAIGLIPKDTSLVFYHCEEEGQVEKFNMPDDFFIRYKNIGQRPEFGESLGFVEAEFEPMTPGRMQELIDGSKQQKPSTTRAIMIDAEAQAQLDNKGYTTVPFLSQEEVAGLFEYYQSLGLKPSDDYGFHISLDNKDSSLKQEVSGKIISTLAPVAEKHFKDHKIFTASYVIKEPGLFNVVPPHQDWTFVDETRFDSYTCWVALMDMDADNGAMCVVPGSHKFFDYPRVSPSPQSKSPLTDHYFTIFPYVKLLEMKAGEALIFNNKTIHASPPNTRDTGRIAVGIGITQQAAQLKHFYELPGTNPSLVREFDVDETFFIRFNNKSLGAIYDEGNEPEGLELVSTIERHPPELTKAEFEALIESVPGNAVDHSLMEKLADLYNYNIDGTKREAPEESSTELAGVEQHKDDRTFFQKYTIKNIIAETRYRLTGKS